MYNWSCPNCGRDQTVVSERLHIIEVGIKVGKIAEGNVAACAMAIGCANPDCNKLCVTFSVREYIYDTIGQFQVNYESTPFFDRRVIPSSFAQPQPACVPSALVEDYIEACMIRDDSPKAAATLARRCIQGAIRDFCSISQGTLAKEIQALRSAVDEGRAPAGVTAETVEAIDQVRAIGNIGAHMEKDIDLIIPVDPDEAQALIELVEMLFAEWYVARDVRQKKLAAIAQMAADKKQMIADGRAAKALSATTNSP